MLKCACVRAFSGLGNEGAISLAGRGKNEHEFDTFGSV